MNYRNNRWFNKDELLENINRSIKKGKEWMRNFLNRIPDQVSRLVIVFAALIIIVLIIKAWVIPPELKETGIYRTSAIETELAKPAHYVGNGYFKWIFTIKPNMFKSSKYYDIDNAVDYYYNPNKKVGLDEPGSWTELIIKNDFIIFTDGGGA